MTAAWEDSTSNAEVSLTSLARVRLVFSKWTNVFAVNYKQNVSPDSLINQAKYLSHPVNLLSAQLLIKPHRKITSSLKDLSSY